MSSNSAGTTTWLAAVINDNAAEVFHVAGCGWASKALGFHEGVGPYFSLPEALRRIEHAQGESIWVPHRIHSRIEYPPSVNAVDPIAANQAPPSTRD